MALFGRPSPEEDRKAQAWAEWFARRNPLSIASFVLGVFSLIEFGALFIFGVAGIVLGVMARRQIRRAVPGGDGSQGGRLAAAGIMLSIASLVVAGVIYSKPWW